MEYRANAERLPLVFRFGIQRARFFQRMRVERHDCVNVRTLRVVRCNAGEVTLDKHLRCERTVVKRRVDVSDGHRVEVERVIDDG